MVIKKTFEQHKRGLEDPVSLMHSLQVMKGNKNMTFHCDLLLLPLPHLRLFFLL